MIRRPSFLFFIFIFLPASLWGESVYLKPSEALKIIFHDSKEIISEKKTLSPDRKMALEKKIGTKLEKDTWNFYIAKSDGKIDGYAVIDNEVGKTDPITFLTAITPQGEVKEVEILVYREAYGSEVKEKRFLKQYEGKKNEDPIRLGQDIRPITGATLSSRAISVGVKRDLLVWNEFFGSGKK